MPEKRTETISEGYGNGRLMSIREVSRLTGVPPHTLRFWEKEMPEVLHPARTPGGQRRYDSQTIERINIIKGLSEGKRLSLAAIRQRLGKAGSDPALQPNISRHERAERTVEMIVDEFADLLKDRLLRFLTDSASVKEAKAKAVESISNQPKL